MSRSFTDSLAANSGASRVELSTKRQPATTSSRTWASGTIQLQRKPQNNLAENGLQRGPALNSQIRNS